eukprot:6491250-Amphidinium_carterae.1
MSASPGLFLRTEPNLVRCDPAAVHHALLLKQWHEILRSGLIDREVMWAALTHACARLSNSRRPWAKVGGPTAALVMSMARLHWAIHDLGIWSTDEGIGLNLDDISARYLSKLATSASGRWNERFALWHRGVFQSIPEVPALWLRPLHSTLAKLSANRLQRKCLQGVMAGGRWTQERLHRRGMASHPMCLACNMEVGTAEHRVLRCIGWEQHRRAHLSTATRQWIDAGASGIAVELLVNAWVPLPCVAAPPAHDAVIMSKGPRTPFTGKVFTDGSAKLPKDQQLRRAGFAIVAVTAWDICKLVYGCVPTSASAEQTVEAAETYAVSQLAWCGQAPLVVHTDCQSVYGIGVQGPQGLAWRASMSAHLWAELWRAFPNAGEVTFIKVKAHLKYRSVVAGEVSRELWFGNTVADGFAGIGVAMHPGGKKLQQQAEELTGRLTELWSWMAAQEALLAQKEFTDCDDIKRGEGLALGELRDSQQDLGSRRKRACWHPPAWLLLLAQQATPVRAERVQVQGEASFGVRAGSACTKQVLTDLNWTHELCLHDVLDEEGAFFGQLVTCAVCGAYAHVRRGMLHRECQGRPVTPSLQRQRQRVQRGLHPSQSNTYARLSLRLRSGEDLMALCANAAWHELEELPALDGASM